jgi:hypothetical protein
MTEPLVLQCPDYPVDFETKLVKQTWPSEEPTPEPRDALIDIRTHGIKQYSTKGVKLANVVQWVKDHLPPGDLMVTLVNDPPIVFLMLISEDLMTPRGALAHSGDCEGIPSMPRVLSFLTQSLEKGFASKSCYCLIDSHFT